MKRVFLSFRAEDVNQVRGLRLLASNPEFDLSFYDESVRTPYDSKDANYIKSKIREKISRASVTVCLVSELTHKSSWVDWEVEESFEQGNTLIFMGLPRGPHSIILPEAARKRSCTWLLWDHEKLAHLIRSAP